MKDNVKLPPRLQATLDLVPRVALSVADIGSGHGAVAAALAARGLRVVATERTLASFAALQDDVQALAQANNFSIETRLGDGFAALHRDEVEVVVIAGLGGRSAMQILDRASWLPRWLVLQPMQDAHLLADWLAHRGWESHESRIAQRGRWYLGWLVLVPAGEPRRAA